MLFKRFIASIMAAAVALTMLSSAPARADNDTAKIIAGAAALAIIGIAISEANDRDNYYVSRHGYNPYRAQRNYNRYVRQQRYQRHQYRQHRRHHDHRHDGRRHNNHRNW